MRIQFVPVANGTYFGQSMTADDVYTIAGTGTAGSTGDGGAATSAKLNYPGSVALDSSGNLFIHDDSNDRIQMVPKSSGSHFGQSMTADDMYTVAGVNGTSGYSGDGGIATSADIGGGEGGITLDLYGNLYIADSSNKRVRFVAAANGTYFGATRTDGDIYTIAGNGESGYSGVGGAATSAAFDESDGVAVDSEGNVYIADYSYRRVLFVPVSSGTHFAQSMTANHLYLIAGSGEAGDAGDGGPATSASFHWLGAATVDSSGNAYVVNRYSDSVRELGFAPENTAAPAISGTVVEGQTLTASNGTWTGSTAVSPITYTYQWQSCNSSGGSCSNISGATSNTYVLTSASVGDTVKVMVTATNGLASTNATASHTVVVTGATPENTTVPAITGTPAVGEELEANNGLWTDDLPLEYSYQWRRCNTSGAECTNISGATAKHYSLVSADYDHSVVVAVTASVPSGDGGEHATAYSAHTETVQASHPSNTVLPAISGTEQDGATLTITEGTWSGFPTPTYTYQWERCNSTGGSCVEISGATNQEYALIDADVGHEIKAVVTASNSESLGGSSASATSNATTVIQAVVPHNTTAPSVSGTARSGDILASTQGSWTGSPAPTY
jgi:hypothetical protein